MKRGPKRVQWLVELAVKVRLNTTTRSYKHNQIDDVQGSIWMNTKSKSSLLLFYSLLFELGKKKITNYHIGMIGIYMSFGYH